MEFKSTKLGKIIEFKNGKKRPIEEGNIPIYGGNGILGYTNRLNSVKNSLIIGRVGAYCGCVYKHDGECWISDNAIVGYPKAGNDYKYLYYYLKSFDLNKLHIGSSHPLMTQNILNNIEVKLPEYNVQVKIGNFLNVLDKKIELNNQINDNLQKLIKEYYLNIIKESFNEISLSELMDYQGGSQPPASKFQYKESKDNIRFVQIRDFDTDSHICYIPISNKNKLCKKDDILIARYGASLGRICYGLDGAYNVALAKVMPKNNNYKEIIRVILESKEFYEYINSVGQRSAQAGFNAGDIQAFKVKIPTDMNKVIDYNKFAKKCLNKRLLNVEENNRLVELRDTLLPKLMNGEIDLDKIKI